jgi:hypothetical protein
MYNEVVCNYTALLSIFRWRNVPGQDSYKRYFIKFNQVNNAAVSQHFYSWLINIINFNHFTLDFDDSVITRNDKQAESKKVYILTNVAGFIITSSKY